MAAGRKGVFRVSKVAERGKAALAKGGWFVLLYIMRNSIHGAPVGKSGTSPRIYQRKRRRGYIHYKYIERKLRWPE